MAGPFLFKLFNKKYCKYNTNGLLRRSIISTIKWTKSTINFANGTSILKINSHNLKTSPSLRNSVGTKKNKKPRMNDGRPTGPSAPTVIQLAQKPRMNDGRPTGPSAPTVNHLAQKPRMNDGRPTGPFATTVIQLAQKPRINDGRPTGPSAPTVIQLAQKPRMNDGRPTGPSAPTIKVHSRLNHGKPNHSLKGKLGGASTRWIRGCGQRTERGA